MEVDVLQQPGQLGSINASYSDRKADLVLACFSREEVDVCSVRFVPLVATEAEVSRNKTTINRRDKIGYNGQ